MMRLPAVLARSTAALFATFLVFSLGVEGTMAQDADLEARVEERQRDYVQAATTGDADAYVALFTENVVIMPITGGTFEGQEGARRYFEEAGQTESLEIQSDRVERIDDVIVDIGTFRLTLPQEAGGDEVEGGYVVLAREEDDEIMIHRLVSFPRREVPSQQ